MADTFVFFADVLPEKVANDPTLQGQSGVFQFNITPAGTWSLDLSSGEVKEGRHPSPNCVISCSQEVWEGILDNPSTATQAFMLGKLKSNNVALAAKLQQILG